MITEFTVKSGATFRLDKELMTWERYYDGKTTHGKMFFYPRAVEVGQSVSIFSIDPLSGTALPFHTTPVVDIKMMTRDEPDVAATV